VNLINIPLINAVEAISADFMTFYAGNHGKLVEITADRADQLPLFQVAHEFLVLVAANVQAEKILETLLFRVEIYFRALFKFFDHALAAKVG
jgi:hypothetical protein